MNTQGSESNLSGQFLEATVEREFKSRGISVFEYSEKRANTDLFAERFLVKHAPYTSIYGCQSRSEFVYHDDFFGCHIRIECRWQQSPGSVDEKLPYLYLNALEAMPENEIWIVLGGDGARTDAVEWLKRRCEQAAAKDIRVLSIVDMRRRVQRLVNDRLRTGT